MLYIFRLHVFLALSLACFVIVFHCLMAWCAPWIRFSVPLSDSFRKMRAARVVQTVPRELTYFPGTKLIFRESSLEGVGGDNPLGVLPNRKHPKIMLRFHYQQLLSFDRIEHSNRGDRPHAPITNHHREPDAERVKANSPQTNIYFRLFQYSVSLI